MRFDQMGHGRSFKPFDTILSDQRPWLFLLDKDVSFDLWPLAPVALFVNGSDGDARAYGT